MAIIGVFIDEFLGRIEVCERGPHALGLRWVLRHIGFDDIVSL